jgi:hypothetical protein
MTRQNRTPPDEPIREGKYARVERERRFLLDSPPPLPSAASRRITDRYLPGTRLRLRRVEYLDSGACELKLTQKLPAGRPGASLETDESLLTGESEPVTKREAISC